MADTLVDPQMAYDSTMKSIEFLVRKLNEVMGWGQNQATVGYIGNCSFDGKHDDRMWMIFLPHPGRVGTHEDSIGSWRTNDVEGIQSACDQLKGAYRMAKRIKEQT